MASIFTQIMDGKLPGRFIYRDEQCAVFLTIAPISSGHALVVPRQEVARFSEASPELWSHLTRVAQVVGQAQEAAFSAPRAAILVAGFEVPHLHIHVLPAFSEHSLSFDNARTDVSSEDLDSARKTLAKAMVAAAQAAGLPGEVEV